MNFSKVVFVNYFHNGDAHLSRQIVRAIMNKFPSLDYGYYHSSGTHILEDITGLKFVPKAKIPNFKGGFGSEVKKDTLYLNTWYGSYNQKFNGSTGIAFDALYDVFDFHLRTHFGITLADIEPNPSKLFPKIDFSKLNVASVNNFIDKNKGKWRKIILVSNGAALSGQASNFPLAPVINALAKLRPHCLFIPTNKDPKIKQQPNVIYSGDIIGKNTCDLNENAYLSTFCDIIVGRSSGVYTFSMIQDNMFDRDCSMISFSNLGDDSGNYWLAHKFKGKIKYRAKVLNYNLQKPSLVQNILNKIIQEK